MTAVGCCGNGSRASLAGLVARADQLPANTPRGRAVRQRIAYTVVAAKAAQAGNRGAFTRAMHGLRMAELADAGGAALTPHVTTAAEAEAATQALRAAAAATRAQIASDLSVAGRAIDLVLSAAEIGTGLASTFCDRCDRTGIDATNLVISLVRGIISPGGAALSIPALSPDAIRGLGIFCGFKEPLKGALQLVFTGAAATASFTDPSAAAALRTISGFVTNLVDSICAIPAVRLAATAAAAAADPDAAACAPGFVPGASRPDGSAPCVPAPVVGSGGGGGGGGGGPIMLTLAQRRALIQATTTTVPLTTRQRALVRTIPITLVAGTLDPVTLCAPGERGNPCTTICDGGDYRTYSECRDGIPSKPASMSPALLAIPALALAWYFFK